MKSLSHFSSKLRKPSAGILTVAIASLLGAAATAAPKVVLISLDGATPRLVNQFVSDGSLPPGVGLQRRGQ